MRYFLVKITKMFARNLLIFVLRIQICIFPVALGLALDFLGVQISHDVFLMKL